MRWQYDDGGRAAAGYRGVARDCVVRAIAIAASRPYVDVYRALAAGTASERRSTRGGQASGRRTINVTRKWFRDYMTSLGWRWVPTMRIGSGCTVHLTERELPQGRLVVSVSKHYTAVIDGVIHDTTNPADDRGTTMYPLSTPQEYVPKAAVRLANGNGWAYTPERCVYGYWVPLHDDEAERRPPPDGHPAPAKHKRTP